MTAVFQTLLSWDAALFELINGALSNRLFDAVLPLFREKLFWAPFYLFLGAFIWFNFRHLFWPVVLGAALCAGLADVTSSRLVKPALERLRPCNDPAMEGRVRLRLEGCGAGYSFTSSHAANHFAVAVFLSGIFGSLHRRIRPALLGWAGLVALAQVYVGVHYPADVIVGGLLGATLARWMLEFWRRML